MNTLAAAAPGSGDNNVVNRTDVAAQNVDRTDPRNLSAAPELTFDGVPIELLQLRTLAADQSQPQQQQQQHQLQLQHIEQDCSTAKRDIGGPLKTLNLEQQPQKQQQHQRQPPQQQQKTLSTNDNPATTSPTSAPPTHRARKPSPGLAARLKALGFGTTRRSSPPPSHHHEPVGRLPEEQLRKLDQGHLTSSSNTVVERRGRPWKGVIVRIPSVSSLKSDKSHGKPEADEPAPAPAVSAGPDFLPEIATSQPMEMDTNKYRLPEHTNGNGVKAQIDRKEEHIARDTRPPQTPDEIPPPPLPKDTPPLVQHRPNPAVPVANDVFNPDSITFNPLGLQRPGSIYTLSRASFANQLAQLTSIQLPDADSLSSKVSAIPTAQAAAKALIGAADQIRGWINKASEVIGGLESDDDVEWAAAGGREGVEEVENAILRFEELIKVYVSAIEKLNVRDDIGEVSPNDLRRALAQVEAILEEWARIRKTLHSVKAQVEIAMEWEELWNVVLGDIQSEMDDLCRLVFEMEERRHKSILAVTAGDGVDIGDLETIVEETPQASRLQAAGNRFSLPAFPVSPTSPSPSASATSLDDSSLLALFARMQPLRASLDFLPMRLSVFEARAEAIFPTACEELEMRREDLDAAYKKLEKDAESLRKELGEDRWVLVFRGAGRQAQKMYESVERSVARLREAIDSGMHLTNQPTMSKKLESYEAKKTHYGPAIERVLSIIDRGVKDRLTVNGEILRLHAEMQARWEELKESMEELDASIEELQADKRGQQLRDSVSSMLSNDIASTIGSTVETPQSSPPSSVIMSSLGINSSTNLKPSKQRSTSAAGHLPTPANRRQSSLPTPTSKIARKPVTARMSTLSVPSREDSATPTANRISRPPSTAGSRPPSTLANRPKWNSSTNTSDVDTGHNFKPLTLTTPSPYAKKPPAPVRSTSSLTPSSVSKLPKLRSPLSRAASASPIPEDTPPRSSSTNLSFRERLASQGAPVSRPRLVSQTSAPAATTGARRASLQPQKLVESSPDTTPRPASSLAASRRTSLLPQPRTRPPLSSSASASTSSVTGRESPQAVAGARFAMRKGSSSSTSAAAADGKGKDARPRWRG